MTEEIIAFKGELMLAGWSETHTAGRTVTFWLDDEQDDHPFKKFTVKKGKTAGHRFMAVLVELNDDETPVIQTEPIGPLCKLAVQWCKDPVFWEWLNQFRVVCWGTKNEEDAKGEILRICNISSRKELDTNFTSKNLFNSEIRKPYMDWLEQRNSA